eukprot:CAMPEP_0119160086 /NCGR_PEP_ID=MMETSP1315-20130426/66_1 /TAXON_ID=676789 /ORGANISM="Prasinoderma singularis, Strain RCC927" /LENGTH=97 /DNA_ID=CAMNT_0007152725 /DNA_START=417 /DNA_END=705 /DNA_ORIENTATION=+
MAAAAVEVRAAVFRVDGWAKRSAAARVDARRRWPRARLAARPPVFLVVGLVARQEVIRWSAQSGAGRLGVGGMGGAAPHRPRCAASVRNRFPALWGG